MKNKLTFVNAFSLIPLLFLSFCGLLLGCGGSSGGSSSSSDTTDTTVTTKITRKVRVVMDNQSSEAIKALLVFTDESFANLDFVNETLSAGSQKIRVLQISSVELYLQEQNITITPQVPPENEPNKKLDSFVFVNTAPTDGSDIEYRVLIP